MAKGKGGRSSKSSGRSKGVPPIKTNRRNYPSGGALGIGERGLVPQLAAPGTTQGLKGGSLLGSIMFGLNPGQGVNK
jgi:hypothetical protein